MFTQEKQPSEIVPSIMDFVKVLPAGESIQTSQIIITDPDGKVVTSDILVGYASVSTTKVVGKVQAGTDKTRYKITFRAITTPSGYVFEEDIYLNVEEK